MSEPRANPTHAPWRRRRWWFVAAGLLFVVVLHGPLLRGVSGLLVVNAPQASGDLLAVRNDAENLAAVAELFARGGFRHVLVMPSRPRHTDELGITPSSLDEARGELAAHGVPESNIEAVAEPSNGLWLRVRRACEFVEAHSERKLTLVVDRFDGRAVQRRVVDLLDADDAARITVASRPSSAFDEHCWWTNRRGVQSVFRGYLAWSSAAWWGVSEFEMPPIDWRAFEAAVARGEKP